MSETVQLIAIVTPHPDKVARLEKLQIEHCRWVENNEPGTLRFVFFKQVLRYGEACVTHSFVLLEMYKDEAALNEHLNSEHMKHLMEVVEKEGLWAEPIKMTYVKQSGGFITRCEEYGTGIISLQDKCVFG